MNTHTPWDCIEGKTLWHIETSIENPNGPGISVCSIPKSRKDDAAFIVKAANSHDALVAALKDARLRITELCTAFKVPPPMATYSRINNALNRAGEA